MDVTITAGPAFAMGTVNIPAGGSVRVEAGAMAMTRGDTRIETSTRGGFMKGLKRSLGGESFFVNDFHSDRGGQVGVAATLPGDMTVVKLGEAHALLVQSGSWCASDPSIEVDAKWGGSKGFFSGAGLVLLRCTGNGDILLATYGAIISVDLAAGEEMTLDNGHIVAFDESVQYSIHKAGNWKSTILGGEGLVTHFVGPGRLWLQTRSSNDLVGWIQQVNPQSSS